jgi:hypothetical protein
MILIHPVRQCEVHAEAAEWLPGCAYFRCTETGLEWLYPQPLGVPVFPDFSAYGDQLLASASPEIVRRSSPPNEHAAFAWARKHLKPRSVVLELFAESGRFAWWMRETGYRVHVADPLATHTSVLRKYGFPSAQALLPEELPAEWPLPDVVFILESIVRLPKPRAYLEALRGRFPAAKVYLTAPSMRRPLKLQSVTCRGGYPPDFMTRWTMPALRSLLQHAGYEAEGRTITPMLLRSVALQPYRWKRHIFNCLLNASLWLNGEREFSVSAWGQPHARSQ